MRKITTTISLLLLAAACADTHEPEPADDWREDDAGGDGDGDGDGDGAPVDMGIAVAYPDLCDAWSTGDYAACVEDCPAGPVFHQRACKRSCYVLTHRDLAACWASLDPSTPINPWETAGDGAIYHECEAEAFTPCAGCWSTGKANGCTDAESCPGKYAECVAVCDEATEVCEW